MAKGLRVVTAYRRPIVSSASFPYIHIGYVKPSEEKKKDFWIKNFENLDKSLKTADKNNQKFMMKTVENLIIKFQLETAEDILKHTSK